MMDTPTTVTTAAAAPLQVHRHNRQNVDGPQTQLQTQSQARPIIVKKKLGFLQRWMNSATSRGRSLRERSDSTATAVTVSSTASLSVKSATAGAGASSSEKKTMMKTGMADTTYSTMTVASTRRDLGHHQHSNTEMVNSCSQTSSDLMPFLEKDCPRDLVAQIMTYVGPQTVQTLNRTNTFWHNLLKEESTWKTMCEGLYKVRFHDEVNYRAILR